MHKFRLNPVLVSLLCMLPPLAFADGNPPLELKLQQEMLPVADGGEDLPLFIRADRIQGHQDRDFEATGNAEFRKRGQSIAADWLKYLKTSDEIEARGHVRIDQNGNIIEGPKLQLQIKSNIGYMDQPRYHLQGMNGRGHASSIEFAGKDKYRLHKAVYTTCPVGNDDWFLRVGELDLDQVEQVGVARDASISFKGVPIFYTPWLNFPTGNRRRSGFLAPIFGSTAASGTEITVPYYWNIAPNLDATIAPRIMAKRGAMLNTEFRYLGASYSGEAHINVLPYDNITKQTREEMRLVHNQDFGNGWSGGLNLQQVSDNNYYLDLSSLVLMTSQTILPREGHLTYNGGWWSFTSRVQKFQTLQNPLVPVVAPYAATPQFLLNASRTDLAGANVTFNGEYDDFSHPTLVNGKRLVVYPTVSYPIRNAAAFFTPKIGLHSASYSLGANNAANLPNSTVNIPVASLDSGLYFERNRALGNRDLIQTLEPRVYYLYVPYKNQDNLPNFDSAPMTFSYAQMFTENQFSGNDRFSDANEVTFAMTSRFIQKDTGEERLRMTVAQRFYLQSPKLVPVTTATSDVLASVGGRVSKALRFDSYVQYNPRLNQAQFISMYAHYQPEIGKLLNLGYLYNRTILPLTTAAYGISYASAVTNAVPGALLAQGYALNQVDVSGQWPLYGRWNGVGRWNYSLANRQLLEGVLGVEYDSSCWAMRFVAKRFATAFQQSASAFFVQLELDGLARLGSDPLDALRTSIPGYSKTNIPPASN